MWFCYLMGKELTDSEYYLKISYILYVETIEKSNEIKSTGGHAVLGSADICN